MSEPPRVVVVGSCNQDLISYVPRLPKLGETIHGTNFHMGYGGKGANQCVMAARLGARVAMVAKVGDDVFGHGTLQNFKDNHINCDHVTITTEAHSGVAPIAVDEQGHNTIVVVNGANDTLSLADVQAAEGPLLSRASVIVCQLEVPPETSLAALKTGKKYGAVTIFNCAPGVTSLSSDFYQNTDILCLNETEAELLTGQPIPDLPSAYKAVEILDSRGAGCVVLTLGEKGVVFKGRGRWAGSDEDLRHIEAEKVDVVDTTGAGDAFVGSMAYYLACHPGLPFEEVIRRSSIIAGSTVTAQGTQTSYLVDKLSKELFVS